jgi:hypothetical protein
MAFGQYLGYICGVVGAIIGGVLGAIGTYGFGAPAGAAWGFAIGSAIGGIAGQVFWPEKADINTPPPPQPHETRLQFSSWGMSIPIQYGSGRMAGNIIYMSDIKETIVRYQYRNEGVRYYDMTKTYTATFAIAFCEGPVTGVARIWMNNKIFADFRDPTGPYFPIGYSGLALANAGTSENRFDAYFSIYFGDDDQVFDPYIATLITAAETPSYKNMCYLVFRDFPVGEFSGVPNLEIEIAEATEIYADSPGVPVIPPSWNNIDLSSWTEVDIADNLAFNSSTITITNAGDGAYCLIYQYPATYGPDTKFRVAFNIDSLGGIKYQEVTVLLAQDAGGNYVNCQLTIGPTSLGIYLISSGTSDTRSYSGITYPFARWVEMEFTTAGCATLKIYSDEYITLEETINVFNTGMGESPSIVYLSAGVITALYENNRSPLNMTISGLRYL